MSLLNNLEGYERIKKVLTLKHHKYIETIELKTGDAYYALVSYLPFDSFTRERLKGLSQQLKINMKLNHPAIQKFYGFSPVNFKNIPKPVILLEKTSNYLLKQYLLYQRNGRPLPGWNDTTKLIIIYEIASAMNYLHSHNILHCKLQPSKISINEHLFPKVTDFSNSKDISQITNSSSFSKSKGKMAYMAPEVLTNLEFSKASDVYSFSIILYEIISKNEPLFTDLNIVDYIANQNKRPILFDFIPECYKNLLKRCWSQNPKDRPSFEQILYELKTKPDFITEKVNKEEYFNYIQMIDDYQVSFGSSIEPKLIDDIIKKYSGASSNISNLYLNSTFLSDSNEFKKLENYRIIELFKKTNFFTSYLVENKENNIKFIAKSYSSELSYLLRHEIINFCTEVNIIAQLNHPSILKFINYSPIDFKNQLKPVVIVENYNKTLYYVFKTMKNHMIIPQWDDTQKLITLYGIASGMAYLHSHNIIHRDLKPNNICLDENYYPRISGFHLSQYVSNEKNHRLQGTPAYLAPEIYLNYEYSKMSDVYSYSLIIYEMLTGEKPYYNLTSPENIKKCVTMGLVEEEEDDDSEGRILEKTSRPLFKTPIPKIYQELIERCWSVDPKSRPTFDEIVTELRTNPEYITDTIDKECFEDYVDYIDKYKITFEPSRRISQLDIILKSNINTYKDIDFFFGLKNTYKTEYNNIHYKRIQLANYRMFDDALSNDSDDSNDSNDSSNSFFTNYYSREIDEIYDKKNYYTVKKMTSENKYRSGYYGYYDRILMLKTARKKLANFFKFQVTSFVNELNIGLQLKHPCIVECLGCIPCDEDNKPAIIYEWIGKELGKILKLEQMQKARLNKKLRLDSDSEEESKSSDSEKNSKSEEESKSSSDSEEESKSSSDSEEESKSSSDSEKESKSTSDSEKESKSTSDSEKESKSTSDSEKEPKSSSDSEKESKSTSDSEKNSKSEEEPKSFSDSEKKLKSDDFDSSSDSNKFIDYALMNEYIQYEWDDTHKLITIYGIALGMAYLHSHNIIHRDLKPDNIYLYENCYYPVISGFHLSQYVSNEKNHRLQGTPAYLAPEIYLNYEYSKMSDVYSYSLIIYEMLTGEKPYYNLTSPKDIKEYITKECTSEETNRPLFKTPIPKIYQELIERCWSVDPKSRPTFDEIVTELRTNPEYITETIDKECFEDYIDCIEEKQKEGEIIFKSSNKIPNLEEYFQAKLWSFQDFSYNINLNDNYSTELNNINIDTEFFDLHKLETNSNEINCSTLRTHFDFIPIIQDIKTGFKYSALKYPIGSNDYFGSNDYLKTHFLDFTRDLYQIMQLNHPCFLNFVGYSPIFDEQTPSPTIITECAANSTLFEIISINQKEKVFDEWNDTKKLINLYGIASGMLFAHSHEIIHQNLNSKSIYLDEFLFPKINAAGMNTKEILFENAKLQSFKDFKDNEYRAPEILSKFLFSEAANVYSFGIIAFEIILDIKTYNNSEFNIQKVVELGARPSFTKQIPNCYKNLIEKCWAQNPKERPTFECIVNELRNNSEFITENVNKEEYENYIKMIEEAPISFESNKTFRVVNDFNKNKINKFNAVDVNSLKKKLKKKVHFAINMGSLSLDLFQKQSKIGQGVFGTVYKVIKKGTNEIFAAKVSIYEMDVNQEDTVINLSREVDIMSKLNHPSILKFIGYNPCNFSSKPKPCIITELASNGSLDRVIELERKGQAPDKWNETKKLINIYGIASSMAYLHKLNIIHRDLKPENILLDDYLYPKLADFGLSKFNDGCYFSPNIGSGLKGTIIYCAPEILAEYEYSKASDVYAFGMMVYELITTEKLFEKCNFYQIISKISDGYRPEFKFMIPYCYRKLIVNCWDQESFIRPSFDSIVYILRNNSDFISENVDKNEFLDYVSMIDDYFDETKVQINYQLPKIDKILFNSNELNENVAKETLLSNNIFLDINKYVRGNIISKSDFFKVYEIKEVETGNIYTAKFSMIKINKFTEKDIHELSIKLKIISQLNHQSLLKFVGFSPFNFKEERKPCIVTEHICNGTLKEIFELEREKVPINGWNETKKLIVIYGIASGMAYLHSFDLIHRDLKPENIFLDEFLLPKIGDFGLSNCFLPSDSISHQSISVLKANPIYSAPEILQENNYSKAGDVYAFAFIVYEIITSDIPSTKLNNSKQIYNEIVVNGNRPKINENVPQYYTDLIEKCWSSNPDDRPTFEDIVYYLKENQNFIADKIVSKDFLNYASSIDKYQNQLITQQKVEENGAINVKEVNINETNNKNDDTYVREVNINETDNKNNDINVEEGNINETDNKNDDIYIREVNINEKDNKNNDINVEEGNINETDNKNDDAYVREVNINETNNKNDDLKEKTTTNTNDKIDELISCNDANKLMHFLNNNCDNETISSVFDRCLIKSPDLFQNLCEEGISMNNPVAHHKYALHLISTITEGNKKTNIEKVRNHLKLASENGFDLSYFLLSRLSHEYFNEDNYAYEIAQKGANKNEKYSKCLLGYFIAHGIGTKKDFKRGISMMLESAADDFYELFSNDIGIYYIMQSKEEGKEKDEMFNKAFEFFEKAFNSNQTKATINNYGLCFMLGIGIEKNMKKAEEIFLIGVNNQNDANSMFHSRRNKSR